MVWRGSLTKSNCKVGVSPLALCGPAKLARIAGSSGGQEPKDSAGSGVGSGGVGSGVGLGDPRLLFDVQPLGTPGTPLDRPPPSPSSPIGVGGGKRLRSLRDYPEAFRHAVSPRQEKLECNSSIMDGHVGLITSIECAGFFFDSQCDGWID